MIIRLLFLLHLILLFVASSTTAKDIPGFWYIDCGGFGYESDDGITYVSDDGFVRTGVIREGLNGTLRAFPSKKMNKFCYTVPVGKGVKILVKVGFFYGNYDGLGSPPEMELIFDGYNLGTLQTIMIGPEKAEVMYVTKRKNTNICFGRTTSGQDPFVSVIKVRRLESRMYNAVDESKVLWLQTRNAFGADKLTRYPDDRYDRFWYPQSEGFTVLRRDTNYTNDTVWPVVDPPLSLTRTAVGPLNGSSSKLSITLSDLPPYLLPIYYFLYFSEMSNETTYGSREFHFYIDGVRKTSNPIRPPYQSIDGIYGTPLKSASNQTTFEFVNTGNATLPPIISGMEVYNILETSDETYENDIAALGNLQERFELLQEWTGDPCLPENYNWEWVGCQMFNKPRVSKLNLSGFGLSGKLHDFTDLDQLVVIDLHNNSFNGPIPEFFNDFQHLTTLNLADNKFTSIPNSLLNNKRIKLDISGNPIRNLPSPTTDRSPPSPLTRSSGGLKAKVPDQLFLFSFLMLIPAILLLRD